MRSEFVTLLKANVCLLLLPQPLCHTCHVAKPLRSKHCRVTRTCVLMFDHHCPFVGATIGIYNYPYFFIFLGTLAWIHVAFIFNMTMFIHRSPKMPWGWFLLGLFHSVHVLPTVGIFVYHTQLSLLNLTTNEHIGMSKYEYLMEKTGNRKQFRNPWFKSYLHNLLERLSPSHEIYLLPRQYQPEYTIRQSAIAQADDEVGDKAETRKLLSVFDSVV
jgi:palmitoyltransferase ZDHHC13/17